MEKDHAAGAQQAALVDQIQLVEDRKPVMVSVNEEAIIRALHVRKRREAEVAEYSNSPV